MTAQPSSFPVFNTTQPYGENNTNSSDCPEMAGWDWVKSMQPTYIMTISVLGILGNVFVLIVFCFHKKACTVAEIYLSNLAAADLVLVSFLPFWAVNAAQDFNWPFGLPLCRLVNLAIKMNCFCSIYFLVLVSVDRYVALVHTMSHGRMRRPKYAKLGCLIVWAFGLLLSVPTVVFRFIKYFPAYKVTACYLEYPNYATEVSSDIILILFGFVVPVSIISYCTWSIIRALRNQAVERLSGENTEKKATLLVLVVLLAFLVCWVPFHVTVTLDIVLRSGLVTSCLFGHVLDICIQVVTYLAFFNSALNPILYVIVGKNFRKKARELFAQLLRREKTGSGSTRSQLSSTLKTLV